MFRRADPSPLAALLVGRLGPVNSTPRALPAGRLDKRNLSLPLWRGTRCVGSIYLRRADISCLATDSSAATTILVRPCGPTARRVAI